MGNVYPDWEDKRYLQHYKMTKESFWYLCECYGQFFKKETTNMRQPLTSGKRLAIVLHWLAQGSSYSELATVMRLENQLLLQVYMILLMNSVRNLHQMLYAFLI